MEWNIEGKDIINWIIAVAGIFVPILLPYFNKKKTKKLKKSGSQKLHGGKMKSKQENTKKRKKVNWAAKIWDKEKEFLPQRLFFAFLILTFSIFLKFGFGYPFLTSLNLSLAGLLVCLLSWGFFNILKLWWEVSKAHPYFFSKEHKIYCSRENKSCYCKVWKRSIFRLSLFSVAVLLAIFFLIKFFIINLSK